MIYRFKLPYPPPELSPNAKHGTYHEKNRHRKAFKKLVHQECLAQGSKKLTCKGVMMWATFYPPDKRRRDFDNQIAAFKAGFDGIRDAIGIDDYDWQWRLDSSKEPLGCVIVQIEERDE